MRKEMFLQCICCAGKSPTPLTLTCSRLHQPFDTVIDWAVGSVVALRGTYSMRFVLPDGTDRVSPLILGIQGRHQEDPVLEYELPNTIQALLWACCSLHDFGMPEVSPLWEALRSGDDTAVSLLLQHRASPSRGRRQQ